MTLMVASHDYNEFFKLNKLDLPSTPYLKNCVRKKKYIIVKYFKVNTLII